MEPKQQQAWRTFALTSIAVFLVSLDATIGFAAFPALRASFPSASPAELSWVLNAYTIVYAALLVPAGQLADLLGRKRLFLAGVALFTLSSGLCGVAPGAWSLIVFRITQAAGAALLTPTSLALILQAFPLPKRAIAVALWGAVGALAAAVGPSVGSMIIDATSWHWAFLVNVPIGAFALARAWSRLDESLSPESGARPDLIGIALLMLGVALLALGVVQSDRWGWGSAYTLGSLGAGLATLLLFIRWALRRPHAAVDLSLFNDPTYRYVNLATLLFGAAFTAMFLNFFLLTTTLWHYSLTLAGLAITPGPLLVIPTAIVSGRLAARIGHRPLLVAGGLIYALSGLWFYLQISEQVDFLRVWLPGMLVGGLGVGLVLPSLSGAAVAGLQPNRFGMGSALNLAIRQLGSVFGVALTVAIAGTAHPGVEQFRQVYVLLIAGGLLTALLSLPVATRPANATAAALAH